MTDYVIVKVSGAATEIMVKVNPHFKNKVTTEGKNKVLYMKLNKTLYKCMQSAWLLWYITFAGKLRGMGFRLNKYDPCVAYQTIEGSQCTIVWYVDDSKILHKCSKVVSDVIKNIEEGEY